MPTHKNTKVTKQKSIGPYCNPSCKLIIQRGRNGGKKLSQAMPPSLPAKGEGAAALHGPGTSTWIQPMPRGGWHSYLTQEHEKEQPSCHLALQAVFHEQTSHICQIQAVPFGARPGTGACCASCSRATLVTRSGHKLSAVHPPCCMDGMCYNCLKVTICPCDVGPGILPQMALLPVAGVIETHVTHGSGPGRE